MRLPEPSNTAELVRALEHACVARGVAHDEVTAAALEADERPLAYPLGSGEAEIVSLLAGDKPLVRQLLDDASVARAHARFEPLGLVTETAPASMSTAARPGATVVFFGRDRALVREAVALESRPEHDAALGRLLGYPTCCIDAYDAAPLPRDNLAVFDAAHARTGDRPANGRLNCLDWGVFHWISWLPCSFDCAASLAHARSVARIVRERHGAALGRKEPVCGPACAHERFVEQVDGALGARRIVLRDDVQVSFVGPSSRTGMCIERAWPTARDRHPRASLEPEAREAVARLVALVRRAGSVAIDRGVLELDGQPVARSRDALLVAFSLVP